jgi:hypothetical protein
VVVLHKLFVQLVITVHQVNQQHATALFARLMTIYCGVFRFNTSIGSQSAEVCGVDRTSITGSDDEFDCNCTLGSYGENGANLECGTCQAGFYCPTSTTIVTCPIGSYCLSGR